MSLAGMAKYARVYATRGWVCVPSVVGPRTLAALRHAVADVTASASTATDSTDAFDLAAGHTAATPSLRKVKRPHLWHPAFNAVIQHPLVLDVVQALLAPSPPPSEHSDGPRRKSPIAERTFAPARTATMAADRAMTMGLRFHGDKVVIKPPLGGGQPVVCHQDWAFYPHTNDDLCTVSVVLYDMLLHAGGLAYVPGSHRGPLFSHHARVPARPDNGAAFVGGIDDDAFDPLDVRWEAPECPAGSIVVHHARTVHASPLNMSQFPRPLLLLQYATADAWPLQQHPRGAWGIDPPLHTGSTAALCDDWVMYQRGIVRGEGTHVARLADVPASMPEPWPHRGKVGALYTQLDHVEQLDRGTLDVARANMRVVKTRSAADVADDDRQMSRNLESTLSVRHNRFSSVWRASHPQPTGHADPEASPLEWDRLLQFVGTGPYGSLAAFPRIRHLLLGALDAALDTGGSSADGDVDDDDVYDALHRCFHGEVVPSDDYATAKGWARERSQARADEIVAIARGAAGNTWDAAAAMLDIGCADGHITARIGRGLDMRPGNVHGCDSRASMLAGGRMSEGGFTFSALDAAADEPGAPWRLANADTASAAARLLPYDDAAFDLVTCLMTLHHVRNLKHHLDEVCRVLKPGGLFVFREHNCVSAGMADVLDIVHGLHYRVWPAASEPNYRARGWLGDNFKSWYQPAGAWHRSVTAAGLVPVASADNGSAQHVQVVPAPGAGMHAGGVAAPLLAPAAHLCVADPADVVAASVSDDPAMARYSGAQHSNVHRHHRQRARFHDPKGVFFGVYAKPALA